MPKLLWKDVRAARTMLHKKVPMEKVIEALDDLYTAEDIERDIAAFRERHNNLRKCRPKPERLSRTGAWRDVASVRTQIQIPEAQRLDREHRRRLLPRDLSLVPLGEPLPGYSALDRAAPSITPSMQHDPLDDLMLGRKVAT